MQGKAHNTGCNFLGSTWRGTEAGREQILPRPKFPSHIGRRWATRQQVTPFLFLQKPLLLFKTKDLHSPHSTLCSLYKEQILTALLQGATPCVFFCVLGSSQRQVGHLSQRTLTLAHPVIFWKIEFHGEPHLSCLSPKLQALSKIGNAKNLLLVWTFTKTSLYTCTHSYIYMYSCVHMYVFFTFHFDLKKHFSLFTECYSLSSLANLCIKTGYHLTKQSCTVIWINKNRRRPTFK